MKINFEDIKKLVESDSSLIIKQIGEGLVIKRADGSVTPDVEEIVTILRQFGVKDSSIEIVDEGTLVESGSYNAQKLKMILAPFYKLGELKVFSTWKLLLKGIYIVEEDLKSVPEILKEENNGSADDLGTVPNGQPNNNKNVTAVTIEQIATILDKNFGNECNIEILSDSELIVNPISDELIKFIENNVDLFGDAEIVIDDDNITITL